MRAYRYPTSQIDVIEEMVKELLEQKVIHNNNSLFAVPTNCVGRYQLIVLVKKKYEGWRMCIDYRNLNKVTFKNKFHIPIIKELLDELYGTQYISKIDLKLWYH